MDNIPPQYADLFNSVKKFLERHIGNADILKEIINSFSRCLSSDANNKLSFDGFKKFQVDVEDVSVKSKEASKSLREAADYLDKVWKDCKIAHASGTSAAIVGGLLTIGGGIATILTAGAATPLLVSGIVTGLAGSATSVGTKITEAVINSNQIKSAEEKLGQAKSATSHLINEIKKILEGKGGASVLGRVIGLMMISGKSPPPWLLGIFANCIVSSFALPSQIAKAAATTITGAGKACEEVIKKAGTQAVKQVAEDGVGDTAQTGAKAASKAGAKIAGGVIIGVSAAFVVWDAVDLGFTIRDIVHDKGSEAAKILREKADELESQINSTQLFPE